MSRLPRGLSYRRVVAALSRTGFVVRRQKGSHIVLRRDDPFVMLTASQHVALGTLDIEDLPAKITARSTPAA